MQELVRHRREAARAFTLTEVMFASVIIAVAAVVLISHLAISYGHMRMQRDQVFAFMTAKSILSEIQAFAAAGERSEQNDIDSLDDGAVRVPTLTLAKNGPNLVPPDHELSGNSMRSLNWIWSRQVSVRPLKGMNNSQMRYVTVRIYKRNAHGEEREVASLSSIINSLSQSFPPTQVFDIYLLAIENIPGWWVHMEAIRPFVESMITDLEHSNPGLSLRTHWITKASYGRNPLYRPYINRRVDSHTTTPNVYYYPGLMPAGNASTYYYVPGMIRARMVTEAGEINGYDATTNPHPYALADFFNHGMRLPAERAFHQKRVDAVLQRRTDIAAAIQAGTAPPPPLKDMSTEPTFRLLLEDMCTDPVKYRNAMIINLHGELIPMPSIRNYSDPAKSPIDFPNVRVVTHPEELRTMRDAGGTSHDDAAFRVYAYTVDPDTYAGASRLGPSNPIVLQVMGVNLADANGRLINHVKLERLPGGVGGNEYDDFENAPAFADGPSGDEMYYEAEFVDPGAGKEKYTLISLSNTPVIAPEEDSEGIANNTRARLYGMEYNPFPTGSSSNFSEDLESNGSGSKNTARWRLEIGKEILASSAWVDTSGANYTPNDDVVLTVRTRIKSSVMGAWNQTGTAFPVANSPENFSETYTWWADSKDDVPFTERAQFLGDPRYCPYKDLMNGDPDFPDGYNWFFDSLQNGTNVTGDFDGLSATHLRNRWEGYLRQDVGRYFELLRTALANTGSVYNTLTGWSYYYMGHGGEIGYDSANGYPNSIPTDLTAFGTNNTDGFVNNITGERRYVRSSGSNYWWAMPWLGELFPDSHYQSQWLPNGNLVAGDGTDKFYRARDKDVYDGSRNTTAGTAMESAIQRLRPTGCGMFFNIGTSSSTFNHQSASGNGSLVGPGVELGENYGLDLPLTTKINRPFSLTNSNDPDGWDLTPYVGNRFTASLIKTYYSSPVSGTTGSGLVELKTPSGNDSAFIVVNGLAQTTELGTGMLAKFSLLSVIHSFFESGTSSLANGIPMPPRVFIQSPTEVTEITDPTTIDLQFDATWVRWDGAKYTESTPETFTENINDIEYFPIYSRNNGVTWQSMIDDAIVQPANRPENSFHFLQDTTSGPETFNWPTPAERFPSGSYLIRIEAYRKNSALHYSYDHRRIFIDR